MMELQYQTEPLDMLHVVPGLETGPNLVSSQPLDLLPLRCEFLRFPCTPAAKWASFCMEMKSSREASLPLSPVGIDTSSPKLLPLTI